MKKGLELQDLLTQVQQNAETRRDFIIPAEELRYAAGPVSSLCFRDQEAPLTDYAHQQLASFCGVPALFARRLHQDHPDLEEQVMNRYLQNAGRDRMVRTMGGQARALLSDRFLRADNDGLVETVMPWIEDHGFKVESANISEDYIFIKALSPRLKAEITPGDVVQAGIVISNSEVGLGRIRVEPLIFRLVCTNGMVAQDSELDAFTRRHIGAVLDADAAGVAAEVSLEAVWAQVREYLNLSLTASGFQGTVERLQESHRRRIPGELDEETLLKRLGREFQVTQREQKSIGLWLGQEDRTAFGLVQAITRQAQDEESYDRATNLERLGGKVLTLSDRQWNALVAA